MTASAGRKLPSPSFLLRVLVPCAALVLGGCGEVGKVDVDGTAHDVEAFVRARRAGATGASAAMASRLGTGTVGLSELDDVAPAPIGADGSWRLGGLPGGRRLHAVVTADGYCASHDGIGLQSPESDVSGFAVGALPATGFAAAVAATVGLPLDQAAPVVFLLLDAGRFPDQEILDDHVTARLQGGGRILWGGWDPTAQAFVVAERPDAFVAPVEFAGLVAVVEADTGTVVQFEDSAPAAGLRPATFLSYTVRPWPGRCVFYFLRALG